MFNALTKSIASSIRSRDAIRKAVFSKSTKLDVGYIPAQQYEDRFIRRHIAEKVGLKGDRPINYLHGSHSEIEELRNPLDSSIDQMMGPGLYTTDGFNAVAGYTQKLDAGLDSAPNPTLHQLEWTGPREPKIFDTDARGKAIPPSLLESLTTSAREEANFRLLDAVEEMQGDKSVFWTMYDLSKGGARDKDNWYIKEGLKANAIINKTLHAQGYDALRHQGGFNTLSPKHNVTIWFDQSNLKIVNKAPLKDVEEFRQITDILNNRFVLDRQRAPDITLSPLEQNIIKSAETRSAVQGGKNSLRYRSSEVRQEVYDMHKQKRAGKRRYAKRVPKPTPVMTSNPSSGRMGAVPSQRGRGGVMGSTV